LLQQELYDRGYLNVKPDGIFGGYTQAAVVAFQADCGITIPDGIIGMKTLNYLNNNNVHFSEIVQGEQGNRVKVLQTYLRQYGYLSATPDGIFGVNTRNAIHYFQTINQLTITNTGSLETLQFLYNSSSGFRYVKLSVPTICQRPELPTGCEITAWTMMVNYAGKAIGKTTAANRMPRSTDPNTGFLGNPYSVNGGVIWPGGLMTITRQYLGSAVNMTGCSMNEIRQKLRNCHPVIAWVVNLDGFLSHTIILTGFDANNIYYNDPWTGSSSRMSINAFNQIWQGNGRRALSY